MTEQEMVARLVELLADGRVDDAIATAETFEKNYGGWVPAKRLLRAAETAVYKE